MFLASQAKRIQNDYLQHCDSRYYKRIITISSKRVQKAIKRHKTNIIVFLNHPDARQFNILETICEEYREVGYEARIKTMYNSTEKYLYISWE